MNRIALLIAESAFSELVPFDVPKPASRCTDYQSIQPYLDEELKLVLQPPEAGAERAWFTHDVSQWVLCQQNPNDAERLLGLVYSVDENLGLAVLADLKTQTSPELYERFNLLQAWHESRQINTKLNAAVNYYLQPSVEASFQFVQALENPAYAAALVDSFSNRGLLNSHIQVSHALLSGPVFVPAHYCLQGACYLVVSDQQAGVSNTAHSSSGMSNLEKNQPINLTTMADHETYFNPLANNQELPKSILDDPDFKNLQYNEAEQDMVLQSPTVGQLKKLLNRVRYQSMAFPFLKNDQLKKLERMLSTQLKRNKNKPDDALWADEVGYSLSDD